MPFRRTVESGAHVPSQSSAVELQTLSRTQSNSREPPSPNVLLPQSRRGSMSNNAVLFSPDLNDPAARRNRASSTARRRRMSRSSVSSGVASIKSRRSEMSRSALDEAGSEDSVGETDDDVCFPVNVADEESKSINVLELDKLLSGAGATSPRFGHFDPGHPSNSDLSIHDDQLSETANNSFPAPILEVPSPEDSETLSSAGESRSRMDFPSYGDPTKENVAGLELPDAYEPLPVMGRSHNHQYGQHGEDTSMERFNFFATDMGSTIHSATLEGLLQPGESFTSLFKEDGAVWWLDCTDPTDQEMKILSRAFGIHPLTSEDIRFEESREKFELFKKYYFVCFHTFEDDPARPDTFLDPVPFYMIVYPRGLLTFHYSDVGHPRNVRRRIRQLRDYVEVSADWICYALIDDIVDSFAPILHDIEDEADFIEEHVYVRNAEQQNMSAILDRLSEARKKTMRVMRLLTGKADVLRGFGKRCSEQWSNMPSTDIALYLGDISDHLVTMHQNLTAYEQIFGRSHFNFMSQLQMEFVDSNNRMTTVLGKATVIGTVLVPMNLITGLFGMNVKVPGEGGSNLGWFFGILGVVILLIVVLATVANFWISRMTKQR